MNNPSLILTLLAVLCAPALADPVTAGVLNTAVFALPFQGGLPQGIPSVASAPNGESLVTWVEDVGGTRSLRVLFLDASGATVSGPTSLVLGTLNPINIECAATPTGFMVVFDADTPTTVGLRDVHYRTFDLVGTQTSSGQANLLTSLDEARPQVDGNASGNYAVVWNRRQTFFATPSAGVFIRRFTNNGVPIDASDVRVDDPGNQFFSSQNGASVGLFNNGRAIIAWHDGTANSGPSVPSPDGHGWGILYRVLDNTMTPAMPPMVANVTTTADQFEPLIATGDRDTAVIGWCGDIQAVQVDAWCRRFDDQGAPLDTTDLNLTPTNSASQFIMGIAMSSNGEIMATWQDSTATIGQPAPRCGYARLDANRNVFDSGLTDSGGLPGDTHGFPRISSDQYGSFVVAWRSFNTALANPIAVRYRRFQRNLLQFTTTSPTTPGVLVITLDSPSDANAPYLLGASGGQGPFTIDTRTVSLSMDPLLDYVINQGGGVAGPIFFSFIGTLDSAGQSSSPAVIIPNVPALIGQTVWFVFATGLTGAPNGVNTISHAGSVTLQ